MYRGTFFFNYQAYRLVAGPFIDEADKGNYTPIVDQAIAIAKCTPPKKWILEDMGTTIRGFVKKHDASRSRDIGFSFLVLLSQYLEDLPFVAPRFGGIADVTEAFNWDLRNRQLLSMGMSLTTILKPYLFDDVIQRPPANDTRWLDPAYYIWWLRPENAFKMGWWDIPLIEQLNGLLAPLEKDFEQINLEELGLDKILTKQMVLENYVLTRKLFTLALERQQGLLSIMR